MTTHEDHNLQCCCRTAGRTARAFRARSVSTLLVRGGSDACIALEQTEGRAADLTAGCRRVVMRGAGHVVPREAPGTVADLILDRLGVG
jgi:pimeloyl-ACP methyl ester carboxylesterase